MADSASTQQPEGHAGRLEKRAIEKAEKRKASIRARVEHPFRVVKRQFGYVKVRFKGRSIWTYDNRLDAFVVGQGIAINGWRYNSYVRYQASTAAGWAELGQAVYPVRKGVP